jgi:hypothetical protein
MFYESFSGFFYDNPAWRGGVACSGKSLTHGCFGDAVACPPAKPIKARSAVLEVSFCRHWDLPVKSKFRLEKMRTFT